MYVCMWIALHRGSRCRFRSGAIRLERRFAFRLVLQESKGAQKLGKNRSDEILRLALGAHHGSHNGFNGGVQDTVVQAVQLVENGRVEAASSNQCVSQICVSTRTTNGEGANERRQQVHPLPRKPASVHSMHLLFHAGASRFHDFAGNALGEAHKGRKDDNALTPGPDTLGGIVDLFGRVGMESRRRIDSSRHGSLRFFRNVFVY